MAEKVGEGAQAGKQKTERRSRGQNSLAKRWEDKLGVKRTDPNFEYLIRNEMANEKPEKVQTTLMLLGFIKLPPRRRFSLEADAVPDWQNRKDID